MKKVSWEIKEYVQETENSKKMKFSVNSVY